MSDPRKGKSIWKRFDKPRGEGKVESDGKLFYRIDRKTGRTVTNLLEWERSWKNVKILKYPTRFANELRLGVRENPTIEQILTNNVMLPEVDTAREYWTPTVEQNIQLATIEDQAIRATISNAMFLEWRQANLAENARRKALNEVAKTRIDLEVKDLKERKDTINKIMGEILEDMTKASRDKIEKYSVPAEDMEDEEETQTLEEARERGDWLFIFEAARETHLMPGITDDPVLIYERQEQEKEVLSRLKHTYGDFNKWITLFEDQITTCETVGVELSEEAKILYFMSNLNDSIFGEVKANYMNLITRALYPQKL